MSKDFQTHTTLVLKVLLAITMLFVAIVVAEFSGRVTQRDQHGAADGSPAVFIQSVLAPGLRD